ncbi:MAG TPA: molybdopterin-dependent oxidoreductase [Rubneribacter badeniensis]|uniref:Molybdopterin-dependent oxidoreductase n=1 Tax=Rubneribacter badeniensis TaxID=2070688 RepID=A0A9D2VL28_9ACTN|nr:molybdopterin-dependent oxidoreductase [Rubneribacter badeniensis]
MEPKGIDRRTFVGAMGALGALAAAGASLGAQPGAAVAADSAFPESKHGQPVEAKVDPKTGEVTVNEDVIVRNMTCVGCYESCGNRIKLDRETGRLIGVGGNPYHPKCAYPPLPFEVPLEEEYRSFSYGAGMGNQLRGTICGRGNGSLDAIHQPTRITTPMKRAGKRGEGKWKPISWDQLIQEVTEGGKLFAEIGEEQDIEGFKQVHDTATPIDPARPNLGPKSNQIVLWNTRADGRRALNDRFAKAFGTLNAYSHNSS